jgi:D-glycero-alpha-D-manno-heptose 1-phosphate guanylyltransferase
MAPAAGKPFLHYLVRHLAKLGFREMAFSLHHGADAIVRYFDECGDFPEMSFRWAIEERPLQTGGAVLWSAHELGWTTPFFVVNGDTLFSGDIRPVAAATPPGKIGIGLVRVPDVSRYGRVEIAPEGRVSAFLEKSSGEGRREGWINAGIYFLGADSLASLGFSPGDVFSLEREVFPLLTRSGYLYGTSIEGEFIDIGVPEDYRRFKMEISKWS